MSLSRRLICITCGPAVTCDNCDAFKMSLATLAFSIVNRFFVARLCGCGGRLTTPFGLLRPGGSEQQLPEPYGLRCVPFPFIWPTHSLYHLRPYSNALHIQSPRDCCMRWCHVTEGRIARRWHVPQEADAGAEGALLGRGAQRVRVRWHGRLRHGLATGESVIQCRSQSKRAKKQL